MLRSWTPVKKAKGSSENKDGERELSSETVSYEGGVNTKKLQKATIVTNVSLNWQWMVFLIADDSLLHFFIAHKLFLSCSIMVNFSTINGLVEPL